MISESYEKGTIIEQESDMIDKVSLKHTYTYYMIMEGSLGSYHGYTYYPRKLSVQRCKKETIMIHPLAINNFRNKKYKMVEIYHYVPDESYRKLTFKKETNFKVNYRNIMKDNYFISDSV